MEMHEKQKKLKEYLSGFGSAAVAFSGGVDSVFLLHTAREVLGDQVMAITAKPVSFQKQELSEARAFCEKEGIRHEVFAFDEFSVEGFSQNPENRCYLCKKALFEKMCAVAEQNHMAVLIEGTNKDDEKDYRPGMKAIEELGVKSPLRACGLTKQEIRALSREMGLPTWNKPSIACLATRFPYGETITREKLLMVEEAEHILWMQGFSQVRVRVHGEMARIEIPTEEFPLLLEPGRRSRIAENFRALGFSYVTMDLEGYRTGSMNETIKDGRKI